MANDINSYRIRTAVGSDAPQKISFKLDQTFETIDVLSLNIDQKGMYNIPKSGYGAIVGRVLANGGFGIPNAKISVFIKSDETMYDMEAYELYPYDSSISSNLDGVRYNLLPDSVDDECHQNVGTFPNKRLMLDNNIVLEIFDAYYKYTTTTNNGGDYFLYGIPTGVQTVHVDIDLSDIGPLSQRPRDMIYNKGYNINQFESPNKFKTSKSLDSLVQIYSQDKTVMVFPFWGDTSDDPNNSTITRCDIDIDYKFEPTCVFMGSVITDTGEAGYSHKCTPSKVMGKMSGMRTGEGTIEMIRKTFDGKVEEFSIKGNRLIDSDGVWCYQIPMNLDYVVTDEFGAMVPTDDPSKGIATRTKVRFRITMDEIQDDGFARKRARYLVPNNPQLDEERYPEFCKNNLVDYDFGSFTRDEDYRELFWNNVYTVKSYFPRLQRGLNNSNKKWSCIKMVNHPGANNPMPYNNLSIKFNFIYRFLCMVNQIFLNLVRIINDMLIPIGYIFSEIGEIFSDIAEFFCGINDNADDINDTDESSGWIQKIKNFFAALPNKIGGKFAKVACKMYTIASKFFINLEEYCDDGNGEMDYIPCGDGIAESLKKTNTNIESFRKKKLCGDDCEKLRKIDLKRTVTDVNVMMNCIENALAQDNEVTSFDFQNDWINGVLYFPIFFRKIKAKKKFFFNLFSVKAKDKYCVDNGTKKNLNKKMRLYQTCAIKRELKTKYDIESIATTETCKNNKCHKKMLSVFELDKGSGVIHVKETFPKKTLSGENVTENVYYYKAADVKEYDGKLSSEIKDKIGSKQTGKYKSLRILYATDIVLLGSLNECDSNGIPQFFKKLDGTTYNMPPDLLLLDYDIDPKAKLEDLITDKSDDVDENSVITEIRTDSTGADWGNASRIDQCHRPTKKINLLNGSQVDDEDKSNPIAYGGEQIDDGGLFYGIKCNVSFTKPKSCINLSRICEFGVSLDESTDVPIAPHTSNVNQLDYLRITPDGYVSYDELYDIDGRAMFATMNANGLKTKVSDKTGFNVYDIQYLYPYNFDASLYNFMMIHCSTGSPNKNGEIGTDTDVNNKCNYENNYKLEKCSFDYTKFRYGNRDVFYIDLDDENNSFKFPIYDNSFYFYFGLTNGKTAIDKFRSLYYSECKNDDDAKESIVVDYKPNSWCNEAEYIEHNNSDNNSDVNHNCSIAGIEDYEHLDGYIKFDLYGIEAPYSLEIDCKNNDTYGDVIIENIYNTKIYIGNIIQELENDGYECLSCGDPIRCEPLRNAHYWFIFTDANGNETKYDINFMPPSINYSVDVINFKKSNTDILDLVGINYVNGSEEDGLVDDVAINEVYAENCDIIASWRQTDGNNFSRSIGGIINIKGVKNGNDNLDLFMVEILPSYCDGSEDCCGSLRFLAVNCNNVWRYFPVGGNIDNILNAGDDSSYYVDKYRYNTGSTTERDSGNIFIGVPFGDVNYSVTITQYCYNGDLCDIDLNDILPTTNSFTYNVYVKKYHPIKMFINGIDYDMIKFFEDGWVMDSANRLNESIKPFIFIGNQDEGRSVSTTINGHTVSCNGEFCLLLVKGWLSMNNIGVNPYFNESDMEVLVSTEPSIDYRWNIDFAKVLDDLKYKGAVYQPQSYTFNDGTGYGDINCYYNWPSDYCYEFPLPVGVRDSDAIDWFNGELTGPEYSDIEKLTKDDRYFIIKDVIAIIKKRKEFADKVKTAFCVDSGNTFSLTVATDSSNYPIKYYINGHRESAMSGADRGANNIVYFLNGYQVTALPREDRQESTIYGIKYPTISVGHDNGVYRYMFTKARGKVGSVEVDVHKRPYFVGIKDNDQQIVPLLQQSHSTQFGSNNNKLFGVHFIDKIPLLLEYIVWTEFLNLPIYPDISLSSSSCFNGSGCDSEYLNLCGIFAGKIINGVGHYNKKFKRYYIKEYGATGYSYQEVTVTNSEANQYSLVGTDVINNPTAYTYDKVYTETDSNWLCGLTTNTINGSEFNLFSNPDNEDNIRIERVISTRGLPTITNSDFWRYEIVNDPNIGDSQYYPFGNSNGNRVSSLNIDLNGAITIVDLINVSINGEVNGTSCKFTIDTGSVLSKIYMVVSDNIDDLYDLNNRLRYPLCEKILENCPDNTSSNVNNNIDVYGLLRYNVDFSTMCTQGPDSVIHQKYDNDGRVYIYDMQSNGVGVAVGGTSLGQVGQLAATKDVIAAKVINVPLNNFVYFIVTNSTGTVRHLSPIYHTVNFNYTPRSNILTIDNPDEYISKYPFNCEITFTKDVNGVTASSVYTNTEPICYDGRIIFDNSSGVIGNHITYNIEKVIIEDISGLKHIYINNSSNT